MTSLTARSAVADSDGAILCEDYDSEHHARRTRTASAGADAPCTTGPIFCGQPRPTLPTRYLELMHILI